MPTKKIAVTIDDHVLEGLDQLVRDGRFANRGRAVEHAVRETVARADRSRLIVELAKIDVDEERSLAEEHLDRDGEVWPAY